MSFLFKVSYNNEKLMFEVASLSELVERVVNAVPSLSADNVVVKWTDADGDYVTINNEVDFALATRIATQPIKIAVSARVAAAAPARSAPAPAPTAVFGGAGASLPPAPRPLPQPVPPRPMFRGPLRATGLPEPILASATRALNRHDIAVTAEQLRRLMTALTVRARRLVRVGLVSLTEWRDFKRTAAAAAAGAADAPAAVGVDEDEEDEDDDEGDEDEGERNDEGGEGAGGEDGKGDDQVAAVTDRVYAVLAGAIASRGLVIDGSVLAKVLRALHISPRRFVRVGIITRHELARAGFGHMRHNAGGGCGRGGRDGGRHGRGGHVGGRGGGLGGCGFGRGGGLGGRGHADDHMHNGGAPWRQHHQYYPPPPPRGAAHPHHHPHHHPQHRDEGGRPGCIVRRMHTLPPRHNVVAWHVMNDSNTGISWPRNVGLFACGTTATDFGVEKFVRLVRVRHEDTIHGIPIPPHVEHVFVQFEGLFNSRFSNESDVDVPRGAQVMIITKVEPGSAPGRYEGAFRLATTDLDFADAADGCNRVRVHDEDVFVKVFGQRLLASVTVANF